MRFQLKQIAFAGLLACLGASAMASSYFFVQPKSMDMSKTSPLSVALNPSALPEAVVGLAYNNGAGFDLKSVLAVSGDSEFNPALTTFSITSGTLPSGLTVSATGVLSGTPTVANAGSSIQVTASYKTANGAQTYQVISLNLTVTLAAATLPPATVGSLYNVTGFDFKPSLSVAGDTAYTASSATFTLTSGNMPAGMALSSSGMLTGTPTAASSSTSLQVVATYKAITGSQSYNWVAVAAGPSSCAEILAATPGSASGWYTFDPDSAGPGVAQSYYCDMTADGGGWTRIVRQTEAAPVLNWNGGVNGASYALATVQIPAHTQVGFGKDEQATFVDYVNFSYKTGNIAPTVRLISPKSGLSYDIYRSIASYYSSGDPENTLSTISEWRNSLTFDKSGGSAYTWTFSPGVANSQARGYAMVGIRYSTTESSAWTVWVR